MTDIPEESPDRMDQPAAPERPDMEPSDTPTPDMEPPEAETGEDSGVSGTGWRATPHWYAAEIIVVVVGVIIALAANAWWEGRREGKLEAEILRSVRGELRQNQESLADVLAATDSCLARTERFLSASPAALGQVPSDSGFYWVSALSCRRTFDPTLSVSAALSGAPGLNTVEDVRARAAVAAWITTLADAEEEKDALSRWGDAVYEAFAPYAVDHAGGGFPPFPTLPRTVARGTPGVLAELRADERVVGAVILKAHYQKAYRQELSEALVAADSALALLSGGGQR